MMDMQSFPNIHILGLKLQIYTYFGSSTTYGPDKQARTQGGGVRGCERTPLPQLGQLFKKHATFYYKMSLHP